jgi:mannan endo-1,4-beta-mannosidase
MSLAWPWVLLACLAAGGVALGTAYDPGSREAVRLERHSDPQPIDRGATPETRALFRNLWALMGHGLLIGHQQPTLEGVGWRNEPGRSDVLAVAGAYPAVWGWDFSDVHRLTAGHLHGVEAEMQRAFAVGAVNTLSWHMPNPATGGPSTDTTPAVARILPGGDLHGRYLEWLDELADFARGLRGPDGRAIPVIFRPFHERNAPVFWWGAGSATSEEFVALWRFTVHYLRDVRRVHTLLWVWSPRGPIGSAEELRDDYPGDDYVDTLGLVFYDWRQSGGWLTAGSVRARLLGSLRPLVEYALPRGKIVALAETGQEAIPDPRWWTGMLLAPITADPFARYVSYALLWTNRSPTHHFAPYPGHPSADDFRRMRRHPFSLFAPDLPDLYTVRGNARQGARPGRGESASRRRPPGRTLVAIRLRSNRTARRVRLTADGRRPTAALAGPGGGTVRRAARILAVMMPGAAGQRPAWLWPTTPGRLPARWGPCSADSSPS